jgi:outer membrane autotransporter protein
MFQAAVYSLTRFNAAYVSAALAYGWHDVSTDRFVTVAGFDHLTADFNANNFAGRIEGGYRFAVPGFMYIPEFGVTPYAAFQMQAFHTPSYSENSLAGSSLFALNYDAHTTTTIRTELGAWVDRSFAVSEDAVLSLRGRAAWAHDSWSDLNYTTAFLSLPGSSWSVTGAAPANDLLLASGVAEVSFRNGISVAGKFETEQSDRTRTYVGTARIRYTW